MCFVVFFNEELSSLFKMDKDSAEDLDIESKFFIKMPYDSDDPDFSWHKTFNTDDDDEMINNYPKILFQSDGQEHQRRRKLSNNSSTTVLTDKQNSGNGVVSPEVKSTTNQFFPSQEQIVNKPSKLKTKRFLNQSFPSEKSSIVRPYLKRNTSLNEHEIDNRLGFDSSIYSQCELLPIYRGFQLLGDSQLLRFSEQLLSYRTYTSETGTRRLGYCVSGQKIRELEQRLFKGESPIGKNIIMLIGTNDFLYSTPFECMCRTYNSIVRHLKGITERIILLTVPPVPKLAGRAEHWIKLKRFNDFILKCGEEGKVYVFDLASLFVSYNNAVSLEYFEETYFNNPSRPDLIHLNRVGFHLLKSILDIYIEKHALI